MNKYLKKFKVMTELKCSIYKCGKDNCEIIGGTCELCGEWPLCKRHANHLSHKRCQRQYYFKVPYKDKSVAKECGMFYDMDKKLWYCQNCSSYDKAMLLFYPTEAI